MDAAVVRFTTAMFDVSKERPNDINPIYGESLLVWLADALKDQVLVPRPESEDWGWYVDIEYHGRRYMLGTSASDEEENGRREWVLQIVKHRSLTEKLTGKEKMTAADSCVQLLLRALRNEPAFTDVALD
jgi:hypothetical protein